MGTPPAVRARGITKCFGDVVALDGVELDVAQGQIHGLVGPNGAGKTTLLGLLLGWPSPTAANSRSWVRRSAGRSPFPMVSQGSSTVPGSTRH